MLELRPSRAEEIPAQKALWKAAFGDEDSYIDYFYDHCVTAEDMLVLVEDGVLCSMLALLPVTLVLPDATEISAPYVYALATNPEARKMGFGRKLLQYADEYLAERGVDCVTVVPAEPSLHKFFSTVGFTECFALRKIEYLQSEISAAAAGDSAAPVGPREYGVLREKLLAGFFHAVYPPALLTYQQGVSRAGGGDLLRLDVSGSLGCATVEYTARRGLVIKEMLIPADKITAALAAVAAAFPAEHYHLRTPALWDGPQTSYLQPFAMIKWLSGRAQNVWGGERTAYFGLAFD
jgi:GNAT superfamily N-acetyltransferase